MKFIRSMVALFVLSILGCSPAELAHQQSFALAQAQTKHFEVPYNVVWAATMNFLQDNFYNIGVADKDSLILGANKVKSKKDPSQELYWADVRKGDYIVVNCTFDPIDRTNTRIRVNITTTRDKGSVGYMAFGVVETKSKKDVTPITDPTVYKAFLDNLNRSIQRRWLAQQMREGSSGESK